MTKSIDRLTNAEANRLEKLYVKAYDEIMKLYVKAVRNAKKRGLSTTGTAEYLLAMKDNVENIIHLLFNGSRTWCENSIPRLYAEGINEANRQIKGTPFKAKAGIGFGAIHQQAVQVLAEATYTRLEDVNNTIGRRMDDIYRHLALEATRGSVVGYETWGKVAKNFQDKLEEKGVAGFVDRAGREWNMKSYTRMVARTTTMEAHLEGTRNRLLELDQDLVIVSQHYGACDLCIPWEGKVLSLTGKNANYTSLEEAKEAGLFHPNCRHTYSLWVEGVLGEQTVDLLPQSQKKRK